MIVLFLPRMFSTRVWSAGLRRLDEAVRCHPDLRHAPVNGRAEIAFGSRRHGGIADHVPRDAVAHHPDLPQLAEDRLKAASEGRVFNLCPAPVVAEGVGGVINRDGVRGHREARPGGRAVIRLSEDEVGTAPRELDRLHGAERDAAAWIATTNPSWVRAASRARAPAQGKQPAFRHTFPPRLDSQRPLPLPEEQAGSLRLGVGGWSWNVSIDILHRGALCSDTRWD